MAGDASFRRYFRVHGPSSTMVAMDAPPSQENCSAFVAVAHSLRSRGLMAPEIIAADIERGFLLLTDFGDQTLLKSLNMNNADTLYGSALEALAILQAGREVAGRTIPLFTAELMWKEWAWHKEWFLVKFLGVSLGQEEAALNHCFSLLVDAAVSQPQVFMHRDYHSANLMLLSDVRSSSSVGILDFQDAFIGPVTYDLASLLRDCYIDWPEAEVQRWALAYLKQLQLRGQLTQVDEQTFLRWFDFMGLERHIKALFTFARKQVRDHQPQYLKHIPRTLHYIQDVSGRYPELAALHTFFSKREITICEQ
jgi:aminoglycoside/choline kinase family phosphotransferase